MHAHRTLATTGRRTACVALGLPLAVSGLASCAPGQQGGTAASGAGSGATCSYPVHGSPAKPVDPPPTSGVPNAGTTTATLHVASGDVTITLDRAKAPCTVNSFVSLAQQGWFDQTRCHRLTTTGIFILQCGDPTASGTGGPGYSFPDELSGHETYPKGTVAMANSGADTNGSQFFLVYEDTTLDPAYTVFGLMDAASTAVVRGIADEGTQADRTTPAANTTISQVTLG